MKDLNELLENAKTNRKTLCALKNAAVAAQKFEIAVMLRELETQHFPETEEHRKEKESAEEFAVMLRLMEMDVNGKIAWKLLQACKVYLKKKGSVELHDTAKIVAKADEIYFN